MKHTHNWCDHPPEGQLSYDKTWEERYCDTEAMAENKEAWSSEYREDLLYTLEVDPHMKDNPEFWPEVTEWCSECKKTRRVKLLIDETLMKQVKTGKDIEEMVGVTEKIEVVSDETEKETKALQEVKVQVNSEKVTARFWRPWEDRSDVSEWSSEATTLLGDRPVTPPQLVTPPLRSPRAQAKNVARLLSFQQKCEERGLPPSRLQEDVGREARSVSSPRLKPARGVVGGEVKGIDLHGEFERLGAEAQLMPGFGEGGCGSLQTIPLEESTCRQDITMQRLSECGVGSGGSLVSNTSLMWWYQPEGWAPNYWSSLVFYCPCCQLHL